MAALQDRLTDAGYDSTTVEEQLGSFKAVIDGIVLVLNAFAVIALLAASFGIVNTLLMSVQERTREIGLMKAMGMGSGTGVRAVQPRGGVHRIPRERDRRGARASSSAPP